MRKKKYEETPKFIKGTEADDDINTYEIILKGKVVCKSLKKKYFDGCKIRHELK